MKIPTLRNLSTDAIQLLVGRYCARTPETRYLVYQMGKVGSTTISRSLQASGKQFVLHTHDHEKAKEQICEYGGSGKQIVITGIREPLARCISAYFENIENETNEYWYAGDREILLGKEIDWLIQDFKEKAPFHMEQVVRPWFSRFSLATGVDLNCFSQRRGFWLACNDRVWVYLYRLEDMAVAIDALLQEPCFDGVDFAMCNEGYGKWSGGLYRQFKKQYRMGRKEYQSIYGGIDFIESFYSVAEVESLTKQYLE
jgi:hypothetical protein